MLLTCGSCRFPLVLISAYRWLHSPPSSKPPEKLTAGSPEWAQNDQRTLPTTLQPWAGHGLQARAIFSICKNQHISALIIFTQQLAPPHVYNPWLPPSARSAAPQTLCATLLLPITPTGPALLSWSFELSWLFIIPTKLLCSVSQTLRVLLGSWLINLTAFSAKVLA